MARKIKRLGSSSSTWCSGEHRRSKTNTGRWWGHVVTHVPKAFSRSLKYLLDRVLCWERNFLQLNKNFWFFCYNNNNNNNYNSLKFFVCCYCCCWWLIQNIIFRVWCFKGKITQTGCYYLMLLQLTRKLHLENKSLPILHSLATCLLLLLLLFFL